MNSLLVCHKELHRFSPSQNPAEKAPFVGLKEEEGLLPRPGSTRTNPSRLGLAQRGGLVRRGWLSVFSTLAIGFVWLAPPLRAQFAYVANQNSNTVSAYSIGAGGALMSTVPGSPFAAGSGPESVAVDPTGKFAYVANIGGIGGNNVSAYSIGADGSLTQLSGSPFAAGSSPSSVATTPLVPFASSLAKLEIESELSTFHLSDSFTLGANSNGITPTTQKLTLNIGTFSVTIPSGSFKKTRTGTFTCKRTINGVSLNLNIVPLSANMFTFNLHGGGINLGGLTQPVTVVLTVGIASGATNVVHYGQ
jgi:hypothetical protein